MSLRGDIGADEEPEPIATEANHQRPDVPKDRQNGGRRRGGRRIRENHDRGCNDISQETVHCEEVGNSALHIAEFTGGQHVDHSRLYRHGRHLSAADLPRAFAVCALAIVEEVLSALVMHAIETCAARDHEYHDHDIRLHDGGWYGGRELGERVREHWSTSPDTPRFPSVSIADRTHRGNLVHATQAASLA